MARQAEEIFRDALALSDKEREKLLRLLVTRESHDDASPEIEQAWLEEIERREPTAIPSAWLPILNKLPH